MDGWVEGWMDGGMGGWMDEWMEGWMDGGMDDGWLGIENVFVNDIIVLSDIAVLVTDAGSTVFLAAVS